jgi:hypothetical protein
MNTTNETKIALLEKGMQDIGQQVNSTNVEIKSLSSRIESFVTTKNSEMMQLQVEVRLLGKNVERLERRSTLWKWLSPSLSAFFSSAITYLFISYLEHIK